jgi:putative restriction endonuclease
MERLFGAIPGVPEGAIFASRKEAAAAGIHKPLVAGISGSQEEGADSIAISGGYEDDVDLGDEIIYTGEGGQENGRHIRDQEFIRGNKALAVSEVQGLPVRVLRGAHKGNPFAPGSGYRYDGLYQVESHWHTVGKSGFKVWKYRLLKLEGSLPPQKSLAPEVITLPAGTQTPKRVNSTIQRVVRDTKLGRQLKKLYQYQCQVCGLQIKTEAGFYAEAAHIKPVGLPHAGPDVSDNLLCLCPNHHLMFDKGVFAIGDDLSLIGMPGKLHRHADHSISAEFVTYHRTTFTDF